MFVVLSQNSLSCNYNELVLDDIERHLDLNVDNMRLMFYVNVNNFTHLLNYFKHTQSYHSIVSFLMLVYKYSRTSSAPHFATGFL